jgi:phage terminase Nu1 subunit (DNA packaging protein)
MSSATRAEVASLLNISERHVNRLAVEGIIPRPVRARYELIPCAEAYVVHLHEALRARAAAGSTTVRGRLVDARAATQELALAKARAAVMSMADHDAVVADLVRMTRAVFAAVGSRVASQLVDGMSRSDRQATIDAGNREALMQLAALVPRTPPAKMSRAEIKAVIDTGIKEALHAMATNEQKLPDGTPWGMRAPAKKRAAKKRTSKKRGPKKQAPAA